jgi:LuxR family maltose regulon positive regulatory protein
LGNLAGLLILQGQLKRAESTYQQALAYATDEAGDRLPIAGKALLGLGELAREWNDLEAAKRYFTDAVTLFSQYGQIGPIMGYISLTRLEQAKGDYHAAHYYLQEARQLALRFDATEMDDQLVDNCEAWLWLDEGKLTAVDDWAAQHGLHELASSETASVYVDIHEIELSTLARLYLAQERIDEALVLLERLLQAARETGRIRSVIRLTVQQAIAYHARDDKEQAIIILAQALSLAEPENFIRTFLDEGKPLVHLLYLALEDGIMPDYTQRLLAEYQGLQGTPSPGILPTTSAAGYPPGTLIEPLSAREIEVLQLLADGLTNRQIANKLVISLSTVKGHTAKIYSKLSVNNRTQAVARGRALGLLT